MFEGARKFIVLAVLIGAFPIASMAAELVFLTPFGDMISDRSTRISNGAPVLFGQHSANGSAPISPVIFRPDGSVAQTLPVYDALQPYGVVRDASSDLSVIVGQAAVGYDARIGRERSANGATQAVWWDTNGIHPLFPVGTAEDPALLHSRAVAVSTDGKVIVGYRSGFDGRTDWRFGGSRPDTSRDIGQTSSSEAFVWSEGQAVVSLNDLDSIDAFVNSRAYDVSRDGSVVVGYAATADVWYGVPAYWTASTGWVAIDDRIGVAQAISGDGRTIVGSQSLLAMDAFRYDLNTGRESLIDGAPDSLQWGATGVNFDGSVIVGRSSEQEAVVWDRSHGARLLSEILLADYGLATVPGSLVGSVINISDDASVISGDTWVVTLPEPHAAMLLIGLLSLRRARGTSTIRQRHSHR